MIFNREFVDFDYKKQVNAIFDQFIMEYLISKQLLMFYGFFLSLSRVNISVSVWFALMELFKYHRRLAEDQRGYSPSELLFI